MHAKNQYTKAVDMWACGIVMYELLTLGAHPILDKNEMKNVKLLKDVYLDKLKHT